MVELLELKKEEESQELPVGFKGASNFPPNPNVIKLCMDDQILLNRAEESNKLLYSGEKELEALVKFKVVQS